MKAFANFYYVILADFTFFRKIDRVMMVTAKSARHASTWFPTEAQDYRLSFGEQSSPRRTAHGELPRRMALPASLSQGSGSRQLGPDSLFYENQLEWILNKTGGFFYEVPRVR